MTVPCARVTEIKFLSGLVVRLTFKDGFVRTVDLDTFLNGPRASRYRTPERFRKLKILGGGAIGWPNGWDICADLLRYDLPLARTTDSRGIK